MKCNAPQNADPECIQMQVRRELGGRLFRFHVEIERNGIVLRGHVPTFYAQQLVIEAIKRATSIPIWRNNIDVG